MKEFSKYNSIYFCGIGGIGMSALAMFIKEKGHEVSGSDLVKSEITDDLENKEIKINYNQVKENISKNIDLFIYSPAVGEENPEKKEATQRGIKSLSYPEALGELSKNFHTIAVTGTHGKSTTTAITSLILEAGNLDPNVIIGTKIKEFNNSNYRIGKSKYFVIEACEYKRSFLNISPKTLVITNIEADHLDYYKTPENYYKAFEEMIEKIDSNGHIIISKGDIIAKNIIKNSKATVIQWDKESLGMEIKPGVPGDFNVQNASAAAQLGLLLGIDKNTIEKSINNFKGTWRRFERKETSIANTIIFDDYGHHPTEIKATLKAIKDSYPGKKVLCVFQPHQYNRTHALLEGFGQSFSDTNQVLIPNIYRVRDTQEDISKISPEILVAEINKHSQNAIHIDGLKKTSEYIKENSDNFDIIITMGAGDIHDIYKYL